MSSKSSRTIGTILLALSGWIMSLFLGVLELPTKINSFMTEGPKAKQEITDWINLDQNYTGQWTSSVEGWIDATDEEWALATAENGPVRMRLRVYGGEVEGEIESEGLKKDYVFNNLLLEGKKVSGGLDVWAYDFIEGKKTGIAELSLKLTDEERLPLDFQVVKGGMWLPSHAKLYRTTTDISDAITREPNMELLKRVEEEAKRASDDKPDENKGKDGAGDKPDPNKP